MIREYFEPPTHPGLSSHPQHEIIWYNTNLFLFARARNLIYLFLIVQKLRKRGDTSSKNCPRLNLEIYFSDIIAHKSSNVEIICRMKTIRNMNEFNRLESYCLWNSTLITPSVSADSVTWFYVNILLRLLKE